MILNSYEPAHNRNQCNCSDSFRDLNVWVLYIQCELLPLEVPGIAEEFSD